MPAEILGYSSRMFVWVRRDECMETEQLLCLVSVQANTQLPLTGCCLPSALITSLVSCVDLLASG